MRRSLVVLVCVSQAGCGVLLQTAFGWSSTSTARRSEQTQIRVSTQPQDAEITRRARDGQTTVLGSSPLTDVVEYDVEQSVRSPSGLGLLLGAGIEAGVAAGAFLAGQGEKKCFSDGDCFETEAPNETAMYAATFIAIAGGIDLLIAMIHYREDDEIVSKPVVPVEYSYVAKRPGFLESSRTLKVPNDVPDGVALKLDALPAPPAPSPVVAVKPAPAAPKTGVPKDAVIAVMNVQDRNEGVADRAIDPQLVTALADQLRIFVGQRGWRAVDGGSQKKILQEQIQATKMESYKTCYDESCQVELGKALAASHIMRASITRFGAKCVLNGELVDLRAEVTVAAASSTGDCQDEGFLRMSEEVAKGLLPRVD